MLYFKFPWKFNSEHLKRAILSLLIDDDLKNDRFGTIIVKLIKEQFENEYEMFDWTKDIFKKVVPKTYCMM